MTVPSHVAGAVRVFVHDRLRGEAVSLEVVSMIALTPSLQASSESSKHAVFLTLLPKLQTHAQIQFRFIACGDQRADAAQPAQVLTGSFLDGDRLIAPGRAGTAIDAA